jgi:hypothetical protein
MHHCSIAVCCRLARVIETAPCIEDRRRAGKVGRELGGCTSLDMEAVGSLGEGDGGMILPQMYMDLGT